ncbi:hypothetical protein [Mesorhizobium sp. B263B2A]|uniref:hypothetical protein n=1 Tax=Mesorhizobium sp. B263B2A TaxID=2876669 RepID=UPI001CD16859|nr:hypothetical protein [Mesorhizobium sp. B263B2A]MCA0032721.1 hypothetical protein [Mesorhizobium sp. B263B2A]
MTWLATLISFLAGIAVERTLARYRVSQPIGAVTRSFEWPGKPMRIIDAEILTPEAINAAVRGD